MKSKEKLITAFGFINACQLHLKLSVTYCQHQKRLKEDDRCLQVALPVTAFPEMLYKPVGTRGTTATRAVCVRRGLGRKTPFSWGSNIPSARDDRRPSILQLNKNTDSLQERSASSTSYYSLQEQGTHHRPSGDPLHYHKLVIPSFSPSGSALSRKHGLATFVHEQLEWTLMDQSPKQSDTECLC